MLATHDFPSVVNAEAFAADPALSAAMQRGRFTSAASSSLAALGVVKVDPDFAEEYPDGDPLATEVVATLVPVGDSLYAEIGRTMLASIGEPQAVLISLAVIEGAESPLTPSQVAGRTFKSSGTLTATLDALEFLDCVTKPLSVSLT